MPNNITTYSDPPYVDDFQRLSEDGGKTPEEKNYLRILYKPGVSVQARELNQMQSMLQSQIDSLGRSSFEDGAAVVGGERQFDDAIYAVDVNLDSNIFDDESRAHYLDNLTKLQYQVTSGSSTYYMNATVLHYLELPGTSNTRFFVRYDNSLIETDSSPQVEVKVFPNIAGTAVYYGGEQTIGRPVGSSTSILDDELSGRGFPGSSDPVYIPIQNNPQIGTIVETHQAIIGQVESGIFFVKGEFVLNDLQEIFLVKPKDALDAEYNYLANGKLAFKVNETIVNAQDDDNLFDNAQGYPNYKAPGADRYSIDLELIFLSDGSTDRDNEFVALNKRFRDITNIEFNCIALSSIASNTAETFSFILEIEDGKDRVNVSDVLGDNINNVLAQRTEEESGDYAVEPFVLDVREYYNDTANSENRGLYTEQQIRDANVVVEEGDISGIAPGGQGDVEIDENTTSENVVKYGESRMSIGIEPSVAYVDGFRVEATERIDIPVEKARDTEPADVSAVVTAELGSYVETTSTTKVTDKVFGIPELGIQVEQGSATAKVRGLEYIGDKFRLYLYDISGSFSAGGGDITSTDSPTSFKFVAASGIIDPTISESFVALPYENIENVLTTLGNTTVKLRELITNGVYDPSAETVTIGFSNSLDGRVLTDEGSGDDYIISTGVDLNDEVIVANVATIDATNETATLTLPAGTSSAAKNQLAANQNTVKVLHSFEINCSEESARQLNKQLTDGSSTHPHGTVTFSGLGAGGLTFATGGLGKVDAYEIISATITSDSPDEVIPLDDIELDDGQRDGIYKESRIRYTGSLDLSASTIVVTFKYFKRIGSGAFYTKNSYGSLDYKDIPSYKEIRLSDVIDFRGDEIANSSNPGLTTFFDPNSVVQTKVNYYLNRIDVVVVNSVGEFNVIEGTPGLNPDQPAIPDNAMHLYTVNVPAYTFDIKDIENEYIDNRRYTMRDIGDLESRIKNIEYFNTLSLLEKDANSKQITDDGSGGSTAGMERFKNGIVVDSFLGHGTADTLDPAYSASVDKVEGLMRPAFAETNDRFMLQTVLDGNDNRPSGIHADGMATLSDFTEVALIDQDKASMHMSVNPYAVAAWWGEMKLSPSSDQWKETSQRPDVIVNRENDVAVLRNIFRANRAQGTIWGSWRTNWVGRFRWTRSFSRRRWRRGRRRSRRFFGWRFGRSVRWGLRTTARVETVKTTINNKVVDTSFVPFIRSRRVYFTGKLFRPNTKLHLYFDGVDISSYATKADFVEFTNNRDRRNFLNRTPGNNFFGMPVINNGVTATGVRQELVTDDAGSITGYFIIPNNSAEKFRTGEREVILNDSATGAKAEDSTTSASVNYTASGIIQHRQRTVVSTRRVHIRREWVRRRRNVRRRVRRRRWRDPLAQSFMIGEIETGVFATSVDLYFQKKSNSVPVQMYVVTTDNGYPSQSIIPGSEITLLPEDVNISSDSSASTNFTFDSPIYLSPGVEYAIVVLSNDDNYRMWLSDIGKEDVLTKKMIVKNPYTGVMFKSQNASTWTADQNKDFKFKLNRADFGTQTKEWNFGLVASDESDDDSPVLIENFSQAMLQSEEVNLPQTSIQYQLSLDGTSYVDVTPGEEYYRSGTISDNIKLKAILTTSSNFVTPLLDLDRLAFAGVRNLVNRDVDIDTGSPEIDTELDANHGTAEARYITQEVALANPADQITTFLEINRPIAGSDVRIYVRTKTGEENITENGFTRVLPKNGNPIPINGDREEYVEVEFEEKGLDLFSSFQVKIVMTSNDDEYVPVVKSLRSIATT